MNEISNFCSGECTSQVVAPQSCGEAQSSQGAPRKPTKSTHNNLQFNPNTPPYAINNEGNHLALDYHTIAMDAVHNNSILEYNVHNMYGLMESWATQLAMEKTRGKRAFGTA
jgi:hypothetical protein